MSIFNRSTSLPLTPPGPTPHDEAREYGVPK